MILVPVFIINPIKKRNSDTFMAILARTIILRRPRNSVQVDKAIRNNFDQYHMFEKLTSAGLTGLIVKKH